MYEMLDSISSHTVPILIVCFGINELSVKSSLLFKSLPRSCASIKFIDIREWSNHMDHFENTMNWFFMRTRKLRKIIKDFKTSRKLKRIFYVFQEFTVFILYVNDSIRNTLIWNYKDLLSAHIIRNQASLYHIDVFFLRSQ